MGKKSYQTNKDLILNGAKEKYKNKSMSKETSLMNRNKKIIKKIIKKNIEKI